MKTSILKNTILKLFYKGYSKNLVALIDRIHPADIALVFPTIEDSERKVLFDQIIDDQHVAKIISEMTDKKLVAKILSGINHKRICEIFHHMEPDDAADIIGYLPTKDAEALLRLIQKSDAEEINKLLKYEPETAGGIMTPYFIAVHTDNEIGEVVKKLKKVKNIDFIPYIYIVDKDGRLTGFTSINEFLIASDETKISEIANKDLFYVRVNVSKREVVRIVTKYHLLEIPVVNKDKQIMGIITADDVMDIMEHETSQSILRTSGSAHMEDPLGASVWSYIKSRIWWLTFCFIGGLGLAKITEEIMNNSVSKVSYITLLPLVVIMSIISSNQSGASVTRNIFIGKSDGESKLKIIYKETKLGIILGLILSTLTVGYNYALHQDAKLAAVVGISMLAVIPISMFIGAITPVMMTRLRRTPSAYSLPFIAIVATLICVTLYLLISTNLMALDIIFNI